MTTTDELKKRIGGYAFLYPFTDEDFDRYQNYDDDDFRWLYGLDLSIICIFEIANIITEFCETDCYDDCMMDFLITPSQEALTKIVEHLQIQMNPTEALAIVLQHHFQSKDWNETLASVDNISELVENNADIIGFELLDLKYIRQRIWRIMNSTIYIPHSFHLHKLL